MMLCYFLKFVTKYIWFTEEISFEAILEHLQNQKQKRMLKLFEMQMSRKSKEQKVETVLLDTGASLEVQGVFVAVGMIPQTEKLKDLVELDENGYVKAGKME